MRRPVIISIRVGYVLVIAVLAFLLYPALKRAKVGGGPTPRSTIFMNLDSINDAKEMLKSARHLSDDYWPTRAEVSAAYAGQTNRSFDDLFKRTRWGEVYIVNRIGAAPYAYLSNAVGGFPEGCLLTSADLLRPYGSTPGNQDAPASAVETNRTPSRADSSH